MINRKIHLQNTGPYFSGQIVGAPFVRLKNNNGI